MRKKKPHKESKKKAKYSLDDIDDLLVSSCDHKESERCLSNFSRNDIILIRKEWCYEHNNPVSEEAMYKRLSNYLAIHEVKGVTRKPNNAHLIINGIYTLSFTQRPDYYLCLRGFCKIIGISVYKLENAARICKGEKNIIEDHCNVVYSKDPSKKLLIEDFLTNINENWTTKKEHLIGDDKCNYDLIFGFYSPRNLFDWFSMMNESHMFVSFDWFRKVWSLKFPKLICMKDRACPTCNYYLERMKESIRNDFKLYSEAKLSYEDHIKDQKDIREDIEKRILEAKLNLTSQHTLIIIMDHFGTHYIPALKQSLNEFKSLEGHGVLGVYFSGVHNPVEDTNDYLIYNEPYCENSNINCYHMDKYLSSWIKTHTTNKLIIVSDTCAKIRYLSIFLQTFSII